jgi:GNAT superfamily N-acetyltransferase
MPFLGSAAMLLSFDVAPEAIAEHDEWHTQEHMPERLSIPGFLRGTRWVAVRGDPRYLVLYEVEALGTLTSAPYLECLDHPSAWTTRMMPHYRGMRRGLCSVTGSFGLGAGGFSLLLRFKPASADASAFRNWLLDEVLAPLRQRRGIGSVHLVEAAARAAMTTEQGIRGADAGIDWAVVVMGYDRDALEELGATMLSGHSLKRRGASDVREALYAMHYSLSRSEIR